MATLQEKLKEIRESHGLSQKKMAESLNIAVSSWNGYERGKTKPSQDLLKKICTVYHLDSLEYEVETEPAKSAKTGKTATEKTAPGKAAGKATGRVSKKKEEAAKKAAEKKAAEIKAAEKKAAEEEAAKKAAEEEAAKKAAEEEAAKKAAEEEAAKKVAEEEAAKKAAQEKSPKKTAGRKKNAVNAKVAPAPVEEEPPARVGAPAIVIQAMDGTGISVDELRQKVLDVAPSAECIYVKPDERRAYWTKGTSNGSVALWED